jgi:hypothetical protein
MGISTVVIGLLPGYETIGAKVASDCSVATVASPCGKKMCGKTITAAVA